MPAEVRPSLTAGSLAALIDAMLPQTQCTRCGHAGCAPYAQAVADGQADFNQCAPGGDAVIARLAALLGRAPKPLNPEHGPLMPRRIARVIEADCIGCTLCLQACPVDAIAGAPKLLHAVLPHLCTGCELCIPPCPVDCIEMTEPLEGDVWTTARADAARQRHERRNRRLEPGRQRPMPATTKAADAERRRRLISAALERARRQRRPVVP